MCRQADTRQETPPEMVYDARQIANWFIARAARDDQVLSIMALLKLTYIAQGWHLEMRGTALFGNPIEAWRYGPVIPDVYDDFRPQGVRVTAPVANVAPVALPREVETILEQVWEVYGGLSPFQLSDLTHVPGGPWDLAIQAGGVYAPIPNELIRQHYMLKRATAERQAEDV